MPNEDLVSKLAVVLDTFFTSGLIKFLVLSFFGALIIKFILFWTERIVLIQKLRAMNVLAEDRFIIIGNVKGSAQRKGGFIKIKGHDIATNEHCIAWVPLRKVIDDLGIVVPVITSKYETESANESLTEKEER